MTNQKDFTWNTYDYPVGKTIYTIKEYAQDEDKFGYTRTSEDEYAFAKIEYTRPLSKIMTNTKPSRAFYIRFVDNDIVDPRKIHSLPEDKSSYIDKVCKSDKMYIKVPFSILHNYLKFLKNPNDITYRNVIRVIRDM